MEFLEVPLFDEDIYKLLVRLSFNLIFATMIVFVAYFRNNRNRNYAFSFFLMNVMVFFICFTLKKLDLQLGMALGLFAIFSIIRYRTDQIKVKDMTYLFIVIGIAVINSLSNKKTSYAELVFANMVILVTTLLFEHYFFLKKAATFSRSLVYDNVALLAPARQDELLQDLRERTGLNATRVKVQKIDLSKGTGNITLYYDPSEES